MRRNKHYFTVLLLDNSFQFQCGCPFAHTFTFCAYTLLPSRNIYPFTTIGVLKYSELQVRDLLWFRKIVIFVENFFCQLNDQSVGTKYALQNHFSENLLPNFVNKIEYLEIAFRFMIIMPNLASLFSSNH